MFEALPASAPDAILALMTEFRADERPNKMDLGVGVYKDSKGQTAIMRAVKLAEKKLYDEQNTKNYVGPAGDQVFCGFIRELILGQDYDQTRARSVQTPGGSGALRVLSDMLHSVSPDATTWVPDPTWPNHIPMLTAAHHKLERYRYYDSANNKVDFDGMMASLSNAKEGDVLLLHGCCHNPTGSDMSLDQWQAVADLVNKHKIIPFVDMAYQGFGVGLEEDAAGLRLLVNNVPELVIAASCSKNLALYRDRVGSAIVIGANASAADLAQSRLTTTVRANYSMPPDHGAALTAMIFKDDSLKAIWMEELNEMRTRMQRLRREFADALRKRSNSDKFDFIAEQRGMFSRLPLTKEHIDRLRDESAIYIVGDGRLNVAGLPDDGLDDLAEKIVAVMSD